MRGFQFKDIKEVEELVVLRPTLVEVPVPDAEVCEPKKRRVLSASWKLNFLRKFEACKDEAERGKLLQAEQIIALQKKVAALFGETDESES